MKFPKIVFLKVTFGYTNFPVGLQFIFCDLNMFKKSSWRLIYFYIMMMFCSSSPQIIHSRCRGEHSMWVDHVPLNSQANERLDAKRGTEVGDYTTSCYQNPEDYNKIHQVDQLPLTEGWSVREEQVFPKSLNDISLSYVCRHICIGMILSTLLKIIYCFRYYRYSDISRYIKIFTTIFIILEEEMGYVITYLQYK